MKTLVIGVALLALTACGAEGGDTDELHQRQEECVNSGGKFTYSGKDYGSYTFNCVIEPSASPSDIAPEDGFE